MDEPEKLPSENKLYKRLAVFFLLLFGIFWSLGAFFFWILLGLAATFGFLAMSSSGIKLPSFNTFDRPPNSYKPNQTSGAGSQRPGSFGMLRVILLGIGGIVLVSIIIPNFFSQETETTPESTETETATLTESSEAIDPTDKGNEFFNKSDYDSALLYYERALSTNPNDQYALYNRALVYFMKMDYRKSIGLAKKCLRDHQDYNEAWWLLGDGYYSIKSYDSAAVSLERAYNNEFNDPNFLQLLGDVYRAQNNLPKASEIYKKVVEQDTTKLEVYQQLVDLDPANADFYRKKMKSLSTH